MNGILCLMSSDVNSQPNTKRPYDRSRRQAAAEQTRRAIIEASRALLLTNGYTATTMPAIAAAAGVAVDTVYTVLGPKPKVFRLLVELAISGEDKPIPAEERDYVQAIHQEPDPHRKIELYARAVAVIQPRLAPLFRVLQEATRSEPELADLWNEISQRRAANMRRFVSEVANAAGGLPRGMTIGDAADLVWVTNGPEFYTMLIEERGWDIEHFERHLVQLWTHWLIP